MNKSRAQALFRRTPVAAVAALAVTLGTLPGCVGYNVYPPREGMSGFTNPNSDPFPPIMTEAVRWVITRYPAVERAEWSLPLGVPPEGAQFAVNLPIGVNRLVYERVVDRIGFGAVPLTPETEHLPTYHVASIWVSGDEAKVEVVRPVPGLKNADGRQATQAITVRLRGGVQPWHVTSHRVWQLNALPTPELNYLPEPGAIPPLPPRPESDDEPSYDDAPASDGFEGDLPPE